MFCNTEIAQALSECLIRPTLQSEENHLGSGKKLFPYFQALYVESISNKYS